MIMVSFCNACIGVFVDKSSYQNEWNSRKLKANIPLRSPGSSISLCHEVGQAYVIRKVAEENFAQAK